MKQPPYLFSLFQVVRVSPSRLDAHKLPVIFSLPDVCESSRGVVRGVIVQFQTGENSRSTEEGVDQKPSPWAIAETHALPSGYDLTTRDVRSKRGFGGGDVPHETSSPAQSRPSRTNPSEKFYPLISPWRSTIRIHHRLGGKPSPCDKWAIRAIGLPPTE